jgi:hypothetical protein
MTRRKDCGSQPNKSLPVHAKIFSPSRFCSIKSCERAACSSARTFSEQHLSPRVFFVRSEGEFRMKKLALGLVAAATIFTAVPAMAQVGFYAGPGGVGVGVGVPGQYYNCGYPNYPCDRTYYDYYGGPRVAVGVGPGWHGHGGHYGHGGHWHH